MGQETPRIPVIVLDVQHQLRGGIHAGDQGARFGMVTEVELATRYAQAAASRLLTRGYTVVTNRWAQVDGAFALTGSYDRRGEAAASLGAAVYIACHINAGGGRYALAEIISSDPPLVVDTKSIAFATTLMNEVAAAPQGIHGSEVKHFSGFGLRYRGTGSNPLRFERGRGCISRAVELGIPAVLFEPYFGDNPEHSWLQDGQFVGAAITNAVLNAFPIPAPARTVGEILAASRTTNGNGP